MKKVYTDNLPRYTSGTYKGKVNWAKSIGREISFVNDDLHGKIKILDFDKNSRKLKVEYIDSVNWINTDTLLKSRISRLTKRATQRKEYRFNKNDEINNIKIISRYKNGVYKRYKYECMICGHIGEKSEHDVLRHGCPICNGKNMVDIKINSIQTTHPDVFKLILDKDAYKYSYGSSHKVHWKCPYCNGINYSSIKNLTCERPTSCRFCGDGISYPEKILYNVLRQLTNTYEKQKVFNWSKNKKYDAYDLGIFIEIHGEQHYKNSFEKCGGRSLKEEIENDKLKKELAINNCKNFIDYIVIKAYPESFCNIKENIIKSNINKYYDLSLINWYEVQKNSEKSLIYEVTKDYINGRSNKELSIKYNLHMSTINRYLHKANELNLCQYKPSHITNAIKVIELNSLKIFLSATDAAKWCGGNKSSILKCADEKSGYITSGNNPETGIRCRWMRYEEYLIDKVKAERILNKPIRKNQFVA